MICILPLLFNEARLQACTGNLVLGTYLNNNYCLASCPAGFYLNTTNPQSCASCGPACLACANQSSCSSCQPRYFLSVNNHCGADCAAGGSYNGKCYNTCPNNTYLYVDNVNNLQYCWPCSPNCLTCKGPSALCLSCPSGFILNTTTNICMTNCTDCPCDPPNSTLTDSGTCVQSCPTGYYQSEDYMCSVCSVIEGCATCDMGVKLICTQCFQSLYLLKNACVGSCPLNNFISNGVCLSSNTGCPSGQFLINNKDFICVPCLTGCLTCALATSVCTSCGDGYYSNPPANAKNYTNCVSCSSANCDTCDSSTGCLTCISQFYINNTSCLACLQGCSNCTNNSSCSSCIANSTLSANGTSCTCNSGFFLSTSAGTNQLSCASCDKSCMTCSVISVNCTSCATSYFLNPDNYCSKCGNLCMTCTSATQCSTCIQNSNLTSTKTCVCSTGYTLASNNTCVLCNPACTSCLNATVCTGCAVGFYQVGTSCGVCGGNCQQCRSFTQCTKCSPGHDIISGVCSKIWRVAAISVGIALAVIVILMLGIYAFKKFIEKNTGEDEFEEELQESP